MKLFPAIQHHAFNPLWLLLLAFALCSCARPQPTREVKRYLWPASATSAKIEYLGFYASKDYLLDNEPAWADKYILGIERPEPLFRVPFGVAAGFGKVAVTDTVQRLVFILDVATGKMAPLSPAAGAAGALVRGLSTPTGVDFANQNELWVASSTSGSIERFRLDGTWLGSVGRDLLERPTAVAVDREGRRAVAVDTPKHRLAVFDLDGKFLFYLGGRGTSPGTFNFPLDADFAPNGDLLVLDSLNARVQRFGWDGKGYQFIKEFGERGTAAGSFQLAKSIAISPWGHVYVTDSLDNKVVVFDLDGQFLMRFGGKFATTSGEIAPGGFNMPAGIAADEQGGIWVADTLNRVVHRFQYLSDEYLRNHPISTGEIVRPAAMGQDAPAEQPRK